MVKSGFIPIVVLILCLGKGSLGKVVPDYIHVCPGLKSECLKKTIQETIPLFVKGVPEMGIVPLDPLEQEYVALELPGGLKMELFNSKITGIRKCVVDDVNYKNNEADLRLHCQLLVKAKYKAHGNILIVQINGDGDAKIKVTNASLHAKIKFEDKERNGIVYHEIKNINFQHKFVDRVIFDITNLFKGNPQISDAVLKFLNENWSAIADEFGGPLVKTAIDFIYANVKKFFEVVPKSEIIVPE